MDGKRHLPVLRAPAEEAEVERPAWQWVAFGAVGTLAVWMPSAAFVGALFAGHGGRAAPALAHVAALAVGGVAGGALVGRFGGSAIGVRQAALGGVAAAIGACALVLLAPGALASAGLAGALGLAAVVLGVAAASAGAGGVLGRRLRARASEPVGPPVPR